MSNLGYCELQVDLGSGMKLMRALQAKLDENIDIIPVNKLHATIMYDVRNPDVTPDRSNKVYKAKVVGVKEMGESTSRWHACAVLLECEEVQARHRQLLDQGFEHSYPDLLLHVSISYGEATGIVLPVLEEMFKSGSLPETLTLCNETWDACKD